MNQKGMKFVSNLLATALILTTVVPTTFAETGTGSTETATSTTVTTGAAAPTDTQATNESAEQQVVVQEVPARIVVPVLDKVLVGNEATLQAKLVRANGTVVETATDEVALELVRGYSGRVTVTDQNGAPAKIVNGKYVVAAVDGIATFRISKSDAGIVNLRLSDLTNPSVSSPAQPLAVFVKLKSLSVSQTIAPTGSLLGNSSAKFVVKAMDSSYPSAGLGNYQVWLSLPAGSIGTAKVGEESLDTTPKPFTTSPDGEVTVTFTTPEMLPITGGTARVVVQDKAVSPTMLKTATYTYSPLGSLVLSPTIIATTGSLRPNETKELKLKATGRSNTTFGKVEVFLAVKKAVDGGTVTVNGRMVGETPEAFQTDDLGNMTIEYTASGLFPNGGTDTLQVFDSPISVRPKASASYTYASVSRVVFVPSRFVADTGTLQPAETKRLAVNVTGTNQKAFPYGKVWLSIAQTGGGGTAWVNGTELTNVPQEFTANQFGQVVVDYTAPAELPNGGTDTIKVQDKQVNPKSTSSISYTYTAMKEVIMPQYIAASGTLAPGTTKTVDLVVYDSKVQAMKNTPVYLTLNAQSKATAESGGVALTPGVPTLVRTDSTGSISIDYKTPMYLPAAALVDTILVQNQAVNPSITKKITYTYKGVNQLEASTSLIAKTGSLAAGTTIPKGPLHFVAWESKRINYTSPYTAVYLTASNSVTVDKETVGQAYVLVNGQSILLTKVPLEVITDNQGYVDVIYSTPSVLPSRSSTDTIRMQKAANSTSGSVFMRYTY
ncbi:hypothetical protein OS242_01650 [Tumebacillus sp. DT12]|uniref:Bacterial Ig domain-containing protein n=1 Tax=Tumebacillus lacus TaxID=2995335 RepID=A0ABT3WVL1_9BACL|nr:hypothetical protein [Tumebacillus lacus]MCX7568674.1 hypothetical protein [Tumebacillus lacus]